MKNENTKKLLVQGKQTVHTQLFYVLAPLFLVACFFSHSATIRRAGWDVTNACG